jgi:hypothetical protein
MPGRHFGKAVTELKASKLRLDNLNCIRQLIFILLACGPGHQVTLAMLGSQRLPLDLWLTW